MSAHEPANPPPPPAGEPRLASASPKPSSTLGGLPRSAVYFLAALVWNAAVLLVAAYLAAILMDIYGSVVGNSEIRGIAYGVGLLSCLFSFWMCVFCVPVYIFARCDTCGSRLMSLRFPFFVPLLERRCRVCRSQSGSSGSR